METREIEKKLEQKTNLEEELTELANLYYKQKKLDLMRCDR